MSEQERRLRALVSDWQANGNSRELGDPTDIVWFKCAEQLLNVLNRTTPADLPPDVARSRVPGGDGGGGL